jgi:DNA polymerase III delta prime subunit
MDNLFTTKYIPKKPSDIIGNKDNIDFIQNWLSNFKNSEFSSIIISGHHGVGKSITIKTILSFLNYDVKYLSSYNLKNIKKINEIINMNSFYFDNNNNNFAIIIDNFDTITLTSKKNLIFQLFKENQEKKFFPIIFLTNEQHSKLVSNIKKSCPELKFQYPELHELIAYVKKICNNENISIKNDNLIDDIIKYSQLDIRKLLLILEDLKLTYHNKEISENEWNYYILSSKKKNINIGLYESTRKIFDKYTNIPKSIELYETEKVLLPLMIFENYAKNLLLRQIPTHKELYEIMYKVTDSISIGDNVETNIYTDQNWYLQNLHGFYTCVETSYYINKYPRKNSNMYVLNFSTDLNKTSLKNINKRNINNIQNFLENKNLTDIMYLNKIINHDINNNKYGFIKKFIKSYNLNNKHIELLNKIDKSLEKIKFNNKIKKQLI